MKKRNELYTKTCSGEPSPAPPPISQLCMYVSNLKVHLGKLFEGRPPNLNSGAARGGGGDKVHILLRTPSFILLNFTPRLHVCNKRLKSLHIKTTWNPEDKHKNCYVYFCNSDVYWHTLQTTWESSATMTAILKKKKIGANILWWKQEN